MTSDCKSGPIPLVCPDLGADGPIELVQWLVDPGVEVAAGDRLAELLADGVVVHLPAPISGILGPPRRHPRQQFHPGDLLTHIVVSSESR